MPPRNDVHHAFQRPPPPGVSLWPLMAGILTGDGHSRFTSRADYVCPHIMLAGRGRLRSRGRELVVEAGDMFSLLPGVEFTYTEEPPEIWRFIWIHLVGPTAEDFAQICGFSAERPWFRPVDPGRVIAAFQKVYETLPGREHPYRLVAELYALADVCRPAQASRPPDPARELVEKSQGLCQTLLANRINVAEIASALGVGRTTLYLAFRQVLGCTPSEYLQQARIERAQELLRETPAKLTAVARECGFANDKYFMRAFKKATAQTPAAWREAQSHPARSET